MRRDETLRKRLVVEAKRKRDTQTPIWFAPDLQGLSPWPTTADILASGATTSGVIRVGNATTNAANVVFSHGASWSDNLGEKL